MKFIALGGSVLGERQHAQDILKIQNALNLPWFELLSMLEKSKHPNIALLQINPNFDSKQLNLLAETKDAKSALEWLQQLNQQPLLHQAHITSVQMVEQDPNRPLRVQVSAAIKAR